MFGRKKKNSDLDWQPGPEPSLDQNSISTNGLDTQDRREANFAASSQNSDVWVGLIHPRTMVRFFFRNFLTIAMTTICVVALGLAAYFVLPDRYTTKALILVDPRQPRVTSSETVLSGIGGDAAALTSYVEIMNSDGFLGKVVDELDVENDPDFEKAKSKTELIGMFLDNLGASRQGATYIVEVSYTSKNKQNAAKYANGVANAFVRDQKDFRTSTSTDATQWLSERLTLLQSNLKVSEDAVAAYRARNGIVDTGAQGTLDNQQLASLVSQLAAATTELAEARARFEQASKDGVPASANTTQTGQFTNLDQLMQEQDRLRRQAAELNQSLGSRHPRILSNTEQQRIIASQISQERSRLVQRSEQAYETAKAKKQSLEAQLADARQRSIIQNKAMVELANLEREANANRNLYEQFLARFKLTDETSQFNFNEARIVSAAPVPVKSNKPSLALVLPVLVIIGGFIGILFAMVREAFAAPEAGARQRPIMANIPSEYERTQAQAREIVPQVEDEPAREEKVAKGAYFDDLDEEPVAKTGSAQSKSKSRLAVPVVGVESLAGNPQAPKFTYSTNLEAQSESGEPAQDTSEPQIQAEREAAHVEKKTVVNIDRKRSRRNKAQARQAIAALAEKSEPKPALQINGKSVILTLPDLAGINEDEEDNLFDDLVESSHDTLVAFVGKKMRNESVSLLVTAAQMGEGQSMTTDLVREFAIELGYHPVVISLQDRAQKAQRRIQANATGFAPARMLSLQEFEDFDQIPFVNAYGLSDDKGLSAAVETELGNLIALCRDNYGFVIVETGHILDPDTLEDLVEMVDASMMVVQTDEMNQTDLDDWEAWAAAIEVGLVLDQTQN